MSTVLLTIAGPDKRVDLSAPSDTPIEQLLPTFVEMAAPGAQGNGWLVSTTRKTESATSS